MDHLAVLKRYQSWRRGTDDRNMHEIGITPRSIGEALDWAIQELSRTEVSDHIVGANKKVDTGPYSRRQQNG